MIVGAEIKVSLDFGGEPKGVGRLALRDGKIYFEYDRHFLESGLEISPLRLPLQPRVQTFDRALFDGLPGVFNDSLPDGWGRLLLDRAMRARGILPAQLSALDRLAFVGSSGMGALVYQPSRVEAASEAVLDLDVIADQAQDVIDGQADGVLSALIALNGSSAGARPKAMIGVDENRATIVHGAISLPQGFKAWLVKFANALDGVDAGAIEYVYSLMAKDAGVSMMPTHLFAAHNNAGYFATKRFDRQGAGRLHSHTVCGLLHSDFRIPALDYSDLLALTGMVTRDIREVEKMFRVAVFNVLAHNRDDHAKNFSFLMDANGEWKLAPAYDLTFSSGPGGEQSTMVMGEGKQPDHVHLIKLGQEVKLNAQVVTAIIEQTRQSISKWQSLATQHSVRKVNIDLIGKKLAL